MSKNIKQFDELVSDYIVKENMNEISIILNNIEADNREFRQLLKSLGNFIQSNNDLLRKNAMKIISLILEKITNLDISAEDIKNLIVLSFSKMRDVVCAPFGVKILYCK
jgi:hypothetical protein